MGRDLEELAARVQNILHVAHTLREATAGSKSLSYTPLSTSDLPVIASIDLPSPRPLLPLLLDAGASSDVASAVSQIYQRRAEQLKQGIQESITSACQKAAEFPSFSSALPPDLLMKKLASIFSGIYIQRLEEWKEQFIQRIKQAPKTPVKAAPRNPRSFNHEYVPLLEHFFEENPFPTHADKMFLAKKSNMEYKQIHVWFQNRRNRTKKEGKPLVKKPTYGAATKPLGALYVKGRMTDSGSQIPMTSKVGPSDGMIENNTSKDAFVSSAPPHAFPASYPPTCHYDPFPCKSGPVYFRKPEWRRVVDGKRPLSLSTSMNDLVEMFERLSVRDGTHSKGPPKFQSHAATAAITVIPSRAPHPSLVNRNHSQPMNVVQLRPSVRAPVSCPKAFQSPSPTSKPVTLVPPSAPHENQLPGKRKTASLPRRSPSRMQNARRDTTPSESSASSSSPSLSYTDPDTPSYSFSSVSSLSTLSDANAQYPSHPFESSCRSTLGSLMHLRGSGQTAAASLSTVS